MTRLVALEGNTTTAFDWPAGTEVVGFTTQHNPNYYHDKELCVVIRENKNAMTDQHYIITVLGDYDFRNNYPKSKKYLGTVVIGDFDWHGFVHTWAS